MSNLLSDEQRRDLAESIRRGRLLPDQVAMLIDHTMPAYEYADTVAALTQVLTKIRDLAKAGRLDEIFTLANRALGENK